MLYVEHPGSPTPTFCRTEIASRTRFARVAVATFIGYWLSGHAVYMHNTIHKRYFYLKLGFFSFFFGARLAGSVVEPRKRKAWLRLS